MQYIDHNIIHRYAVDPWATWVWPVWVLSCTDIFSVNTYYGTTWSEVSWLQRCRTLNRRADCIVIHGFSTVWQLALPSPHMVCGSTVIKRRPWEAGSPNHATQVCREPETLPSPDGFSLSFWEWFFADCAWSKVSPWGLLEEETATHSSVLAWKISRTGQPGRLQSTQSCRAGHGRAAQPHNMGTLSPVTDYASEGTCRFSGKRTKMVHRQDLPSKNLSENISVRPHGL